MKQTAVEWLVQQICGEHTEAWQQEIQIAKEMEKEQICDAFYYGVNVDSFYVKNPYKAAEQYYNETFEQQSVIDDTL